MAGDCRSPSAPRNDDVLVRRVLFGALRLGGVDPPIEVVGEAREGLFEPCPVLARRLAFGIERLAGPRDRQDRSDDRHPPLPQTLDPSHPREIGRATGRERVWTYVWHVGVAGAFKK